MFNHPEYFYISDYFVKTFILPFSTEIDTVINVMTNEENILNPVILIPHLIVMFLFILFFITLYFSYYNTSVKEENTIDHDFLISNATVEAEEEIGSIDDMMLSILILSFIFL